MIFAVFAAFERFDDFFYLFNFCNVFSAVCFLCTTQVHISEVPDDEVFKICLEFYHHFSQDLYQAGRMETCFDIILFLFCSFFTTHSVRCC